MTIEKGLKLSLLCGFLLLIVGLVFSHAQTPTSAALAQTTSDVQVNLLPDATEVVLPPGASFVFRRNANGTTTIRFPHRPMTGPISGQKAPVP